VVDRSSLHCRFQLIVLSIYKQIHNLDACVLSDVDEDNFDKAFDFLRPIIQGSAEFGKAMSKDELGKA